MFKAFRWLTRKNQSWGRVASVRFIIGLAGCCSCGSVIAHVHSGVPLGSVIETNRGGVDLGSGRWRLVPPSQVKEVAPDNALLASAKAESRNSSRQRATLVSPGVGVVSESPASGSSNYLDLEDLLALAIQSHPEVASKRAELNSAQAGVDVARWKYFPTPSLEARRLRSGGHVTIAAVQQPVWSGGRLDAGFDAATSRVLSAYVAISDAQYVLALRITGVWQSLMQARGRVEVLDRGISLLEVYAESVRRRIKGGVSPEVDRELVESRLAQLRGDLVAARAAELSAISQLSQMVGRQLHADEIRTGSDVSADLPAFDVLVDQALSRSASLRRIEAEVEAARYEVVQKRAGMWPTVAVRAEYQRNGLANLGGDANERRVMLVMDYAPGAGLAIGAEIGAAEARVVSLRENREASRRELIAKISADYEDYLSSRGRRLEILRTVKAASDVLASYDRLFIAGKRNWLDVLNAVRELTQVQSSLADIEALQAASYYRLRLHGGELSWQQGWAS